MLFRSRGLIFVHIPRTGGTSIEQSLIRLLPEVWGSPDYEHLRGWCPRRRIWLQHATPQEMLELDLVDPSTFHSATKVAITRNPYDKLVSEFLFLKTRVGFQGNFTDMLNSSGAWEQLLRDRRTSAYRGDHMRPQEDFVCLNGSRVIDHLGEFGDLQRSWEAISNLTGLPRTSLPRLNKGGVRFTHYSHFYTDPEIEAVRQKYVQDFALLNYRFEDLRDVKSRLLRPVLRGRTAVVAGAKRWKRANVRPS